VTKTVYVRAISSEGNVIFTTPVSTQDGFDVGLDHIGQLAALNMGHLTQAQIDAATWDVVEQIPE